MRYLKRSHILIAASVLAMAVSQPAQCGNDSKSPLHLPRQDMAASLLAIGKATDTEILFQPADVRHLTAPALDGTYSAQEAVHAILAHSGLEIEIRQGSIFIRKSRSGRAEGDDDGIIVTGSRIRGAPPTSPVITLSQSELLAQNKTTMGEAIRDIPQNFNGGQSAGIGRNVPQGSGSYIGAGTGLNLRGLGGDATLTLLNGQRLSYNASLQSIDISTLPLGMIDRIEIVADGASALYGSDAVAGVANIVLKRDMKGLITSAHVGLPTGGGGVQQQYNLVTGSQWSSGGFILGYEYGQSDAIKASDRSYAATRSPGLTLYPGLKHHSLVLSGHTSLASNLEFSADALYSKRWSYMAYALTSAGNVLTSGGDFANDSDSFTVAPSLKYRLGAWKFTLSGTYGLDQSHYRGSSFSGGVNTYPTYGCYCNEANSVEISADGALLNLPGGEARVALGGGLRTNFFHAYRTLGNAQNIAVSQQDYYAYGELSLPLVSSDMGVTGIDRLNFSAALRYDNYPGVGKVVTPRLGLIYAPSPDLDIKGSWGRSFKAPTLFQQYNSLGVTAWGASNAGGSGYPGTASVLLLTGGNPNLKPERAETWSATAALHPRALEGAQLEVSFFRVFYRDRIVAPITYLTQSLSNPIYADLVDLNPSDAAKTAVLANAGAFSNALGRTYDPADVVAIVHDNSTNASSQKIYGVDATARYRHSFDGDRSLTFNLRGSYLHSIQKLSDLQPTTTLAGTLFNPPHVRANGGLIWAQPDLTLSTSLNYTGGLNDTRTTRTARIGAMMTWDLAATWSPKNAHGPLHGMTFALSVTNALNAEPTPISGLTYETPYDSTNYTPFGRVVGLTVSRQW
ncbi:TonB-dependent receptor [Novosphingobium sediminicola]|uniref:Outer membrane receptor protein involved in Fe transport n=1 Tax=Novosphingobium sediminicola TaxID=563162 RepID=A0A7W6CKD7_9SPHN|nr:TonB-dependent receptor [Novosphingobium sediminicola]MBB3957075.1 outer membrane receptor protein involved in Fe transport [Novosphingobium sediminicola]